MFLNAPYNPQILAQCEVVQQLYLLLNNIGDHLWVVILTVSYNVSWETIWYHQWSFLITVRTKSAEMLQSFSVLFRTALADIFADIQN